MKRKYGNHNYVDHGAMNSKRRKIETDKSFLVAKTTSDFEVFAINSTNAIGDYDFFDPKLYTEEGQNTYQLLVSAVVEKDTQRVKDLFEQSLISLFSLESVEKTNHHLGDIDGISSMLCAMDINNGLLTPMRRPSLLHLAAQNGANYIIAELIVERQADVNIRNFNQETPLHIATKNNKADTINLLIELKADIEAKDNQGNTPLILAAKAGHQTSIHALLSLGANINAINYDGITFLHILLSASYVDMLFIKSLLNHSYSTKIKDSIDKIAPGVIKELGNADAEVIIGNNQNEYSIICDESLMATNISTLTEEVKIIGNGSEIKIDLISWDKD